jgi:tetratricopeptide (TPR) repeat protein
MLYFIDLTPEGQVWMQEPECGWAARYEFDTEARVLWLILSDGRRYRYSFAGEFLDTERLARETPPLPSNAYTFLGDAYQRNGELVTLKADPGRFTEVIALASNALQMGMSPYSSAQAHRLIGEVYLRQGKDREAADSFEVAIALSPNIGCRRALQRLRKQIQMEAPK